jgi:hypothetical protein
LEIIKIIYMKKIKLVLILLAIFTLPLVSLPDPPGPPGSGGGQGAGGGQTPVGAPIDGGLGILLALGLGYGGKKLYNARKASQALPSDSER